ncbi:hypothetical protein GJ496_006239 [Pomphorhynchus laevis]|nr:hypothetical protein GJ496_006239 [Pomphorhynchus laevis]
MLCSRSYKVGSIYSRLKGLISGGLLPVENAPIWMNIYERCPPSREPIYRATRYGDKLDPITVTDPPNIIYVEDVYRARFFKRFEQDDVIDLSSSEPALSQRFIEYFDSVKRSLDDWEMFDRCAEHFQGKPYSLRLNSAIRRSIQENIEPIE